MTFSMAKKVDGQNIFRKALDQHGGQFVGGG
jgi:hypothetical protein